MQKLTDNAVRARELLTRENAPLPEVSIDRGTELRITVRAKAAHAKPFGVL